MRCGTAVIAACRRRSSRQHHCICGQQKWFLWTLWRHGNTPNAFHADALGTGVAQEDHFPCTSCSLQWLTVAFSSLRYGAASQSVSKVMVFSMVHCNRPCSLLPLHAGWWTMAVLNFVNVTPFSGHSLGKKLRNMVLFFLMSVISGAALGKWSPSVCVYLEFEETVPSVNLIYAWFCPSVLLMLLCYLSVLCLGGRSAGGQTSGSGVFVSLLLCSLFALFPCHALWGGNGQLLDIGGSPSLAAVSPCLGMLWAAPPWEAHGAMRGSMAEGWEEAVTPHGMQFPSQLCVRLIKLETKAAFSIKAAIVQAAASGRCLFDLWACI